MKCRNLANFHMVTVETYWRNMAPVFIGEMSANFLAALVLPICSLAEL
jgi:hypothetical protein